MFNFKGKKILSLFVAALMVISSFPLTVFSATQEESDCLVCNGLGKVECSHCIDGITKNNCLTCSGKGEIEKICTSCSGNKTITIDCDACLGLGNVNGSPCSICSGNGKITSTCEECNGTGSILSKCADCQGKGEIESECDFCSGTGEVACSSCEGKGKIYKEYEICPDCDGSGKCTACEGLGNIDSVCNTCFGNKIIDCEDCVGGQVESECEVCNGLGTIEQDSICEICSGMGIDGDSECAVCKGTGYIHEEIKCDVCAGNGFIANQCSSCLGKGTVECSTCLATGIVKVSCSECSGTGSCKKCSGSGKIYTIADESFSFEVKDVKSIKVGENYTNIAISDNNKTGEIIYSVDDDNIAEINSETGCVTALKAGKVTVTATIKTDYTYSSAQTSYDLIIDKGVVNVEVNATPITFGNSLSDSVLSANATLNNEPVPGNIVWDNPELIPNVSDSEITLFDCTFIPDDTDNYENVKCQTTLIINKADIESIEIKGYDGVYDGQFHKAVEVIGAETGDKITYSTDNTNYHEDVPMIKNVSDSGIIYIKVERDDNYNIYIESASVRINPAKIDNVEVEVYKNTYDGMSHNAAVISGDGYNPETDVVEYIYNGETLDELQFKDVGEYEFTIRISRENKNYITEIECKASISQADPELEIANTSKEFVYSPNQKIQIETKVNKLVDGEITFELVDGFDVADINVDGLLSIKKAGTIIVRASIEETLNFSSDYAQVVITVNKADYQPILSNGNIINLYYGEQTEYINSVLEDSVLSKGDITYDVSSDDYSIIDSLDPSTGKVSFVDGIQNGNAVITISIAEDECYNRQTLSYVINVKSEGAVEDSYELVNALNKNNWINTNKITYTAAEGYKISKSNSFADENWTSEIEFDALEGNNEFKFYIRDEKGRISTQTISSQSVDSVKPVNLTISFSDTVITKIIEGITFGFYNSAKSPKLIVNLQAADETSGLEKFVYSYGDTNKEVKLNEGDNSISFEIDKEYKGTVKFTAYDKAGNAMTYDTNSNEIKKGVVNDLTSPDGNIQYSKPANTIEVDSQPKRFYSSDIVMSFKIEEEYFFNSYELNGEKVDTISQNVELNITKDGTDYYSGSAGVNSDLFNATLDEESRTITVTIPAKIDNDSNDGDYIVNLEYSDLSGNEIELKSDEVILDTMSPVVEIEYDNNNVSEDSASTKYFDAERTATIRVTEHNFAPEYMAVQITAKDVAGNKVDAVVLEELDEMKDKSKWTNEQDDIYTYELHYTDDSNYTFAMSSAKDLANNEMNPENGYQIINANESVSIDEFTVDKTQPEIVITTEKPLAYKVLNGITFGMFKKSKVTITLKELTSGVQFLDYKSLKIENSKGDLGDNHISLEDMISVNYSNGYQVCEYEFTIADEFRDSLKAFVYDNSGNSSQTDVIYAKDNEKYNGIIVDTTNPEIGDVIYNDCNVLEEEGEKIHYYSSNAKIDFKIIEEYFFENNLESTGDIENSISYALENNVKLEVTKNGQPYYVGSGVPDTEFADYISVELNEEDKTISVILPYEVNNVNNDGEYIVKLQYFDFVENNTSVITDKIIIDTVSPVVEIEYNNNSISENACNNQYFYDERTALIKVTEHNFAPEYIVSAITATDINGKAVDAGVLKQLDAMKEKANWVNESSDIYTYTLNYSDDANYVFEFSSAKDYALNEMNPDNENEIINSNESLSINTFTIDRVMPSENLRYEITNEEDSLIKKVLNVLSFGVFFNSKIVINVETTDNTSGLYKAMLYIKTSDNLDSDIDVEITGNGAENNCAMFELDEEDFSKGTARFSIDPKELKEFRGSFYIEVLDKSGNIYKNISEESNTIEDQITVNNTVIDNNIDSIKNIGQYESSDYHREVSSIEISCSEPTESEVSQSSPAIEKAKQLVKEKVSSKAMDDAEMSELNTPLFSKDVTVNIAVEDKSSGISTIDLFIFEANENRELATYKTVIRDNGKVESDTDKEYQYVSNSDWELNQNEFGLTVSASKEIAIKANYSDIVILVQLTDNAGNISYDYYMLGVDKTAPQISAQFIDSTDATNGTYYNAERKLLVTISERDFINSDKSVDFSYTYQGQTKKYSVKAKDFREENTNTPIYEDSKKYIYTIEIFSEDGEYADFAFALEDRVGNQCNANSNVINSDNNEMFRYDHVRPIINVLKDEYGQTSNGKYYQDRRVIIVTVKDRYATNDKTQSYIIGNIKGLTNFNFSDSESSQYYHTDNRTLTYTFTFESNTSIDCAMMLKVISDLAGNSSSRVPSIDNGADFVVDGKTPDDFTATISEDGKQGVNVLNQSDYKVFVGDEIVLTITCKDENLNYANLSNVNLECAALTSNGNTQIHNFTLNKVSASSNRSQIVYVIDNLDYDGFYDLSFTLTDDSGKQSQLQRVKFALCRNGAIFGKQDIENIQNHAAYNADSISDISFNQYSAQRNTKATLRISSKTGSLGFKTRTLVEGVDYTINGGNIIDAALNCYKSTYILKENAFMMEDGRILDGVYIITITPENTESENGQKSINAQSSSFEVTIDATNPVISDVRTKYTTSYGSETEYEFLQDDNKVLFTDGIVLNFNVSDTFSGIDENSISVTWGDESQSRDNIVIGENGECSIELDCSDDMNGKVIVVAAKDTAGNDVEYSFELTLNNHFWIYVALGAFIAVGCIAIAVLLIKYKKKSKKNID